MHIIPYLYRLSLALLFSFGCFIGHAQLADLDTMTVDSQALSLASKPLDSTFYSTFSANLDTAILPRYLSSKYIDFWTYENIYREQPYKVNLGNAGTAAYDLHPSWNRQAGLETGLNAFDVYKFDVDEFVFVASNVARTYLNYNQAPQQTKSSTRASFGRSLGLKSGIKIDYARTNELGEYDRQRVRHTSVGIGLYLFPSDRFKFLLTTISNNIETQESGGITSDTFFGNPTYDDRSVYPVKLSDAGLTDKERTFNLTMHYFPAGKQSNLRLSLINQYTNYNYHYQDNNPDTTYYQSFLNHESGVRLFLKNKQWKHKLQSRYHWQLNGNQQNTGHVNLGVALIRNNLTYDLADYSINQLIYSVDVFQKLSDRLSISARAKYVSLDQGSDYKTNVNVIFTPNKKFIFGGHISASKDQSYLIHQNLSINGELIYQNNFNPTQHQIISAHATYKPLGVTVTASQKVAQNFIQWTAERKPENIGDASITSLSLNWKKELPSWYLENHLTLQNTNQNKLHIPSLFSRHVIAYKLRLFDKNLETYLGAETFVIPNYNGVGYFAPTTSFFPVNQEAEFNYMVNGLVNFRIKSFGITLRFENLSSLWDDGIRYHVQGFPKNDFRFRLGLSWALEE